MNTSAFTESPHSIIPDYVKILSSVAEKAGFVRNLGDYAYSSMKDYMGDQPSPIIQLSKVTKLIGTNGMDMNGYSAFVHQGITKDVFDYDPFTNSDDAIGSPIFVTHRRKKTFVFD